MVERLDKVGGRASTDDIDGFKVNNGAIVIETGGITEQTCHEVGAAFDIREPKPPLLYRIGGKDVDVTGGGWGFLLSKLTRQGAKLLSGLGAARQDSGLPEDELSTADWVRKFTKNDERAGHLPQHVRLGVRGQFGGAAGPGVPDLLHPQERVQAVRLPPRRDDRAVAGAGRGRDPARR